MTDKFVKIINIIKKIDEFFKKIFQFSAWTLEVSVSKFLLFIVVVVWLFENFIK
jgi:hypothetical protein